MYKITTTPWMKDKSKFFIFLCSSIFWMGLIFWFSDQSGNESTNISNSTIRLLELIFQSDVFNQHPAFIEAIQWIVRKSAHAFVYAVLLIVYYHTIMATKYHLHAKKLALGLCLLYACSDEVHQLFIPGRAGLLQDVAIDMLGALCGLSMIFLFQIIHKRFVK